MKHAKADAEKLRFCREAVEGVDPFATKEELDPELEAVVAWMAAKTAEEVNQYRLDALQSIEAMAANLIASGATARWFSKSDPLVRQVVCLCACCILRAFVLLGRRRSEWPPNGEARHAD